MIKKTSKLANAVRFLGVDQIRQANSGHTGIVLGIADVVTEIFKNHLVFNPKDPHWICRDRFVLSAGHGSALLYAVLYLSGYKDIMIDDLKQFRQFNSKTAGHPEFGLLEGVEMTTGPLGQGIANAVGMALGQKIMSANLAEMVGLSNTLYSDNFFKKNNNVVKNICNKFIKNSKVCDGDNDISSLSNDSKVYCIVGDGCLMEGISYEACSFAGHHKLNNLIVIHDSNKITIDGSTDLATSEDMSIRFKACGFNTFECDGHNEKDINKVLEKAKKSDKPVFIEAHTHIGYGSLKQDSNKIHGSVLKDNEYEDLKQKLNWSNKPFEVDKDILNEWRNFWKRNKEKYNEWQKKITVLERDLNSNLTKIIKKYNKNKKNNVKNNKSINKEEGSCDVKNIQNNNNNCCNQQLQSEMLATIIKRITTYLNNLTNNFKLDNISIPKNKQSELLNYFNNLEKESTRKSSGKILEAILQENHQIIGGTADLGGSIMSYNSACKAITPDDKSGNYIHYGIREHSMGAIMNGLATCGFMPYSGTFLVFSDYYRNAIRMSALMNLPVIHILTHDSFYVGEDGATHQPIEHIDSLRLMPNLFVFRPCDMEETLECYKDALRLKKPCAMILSRQDLKQINKKNGYKKYNQIKNGIYEIYNTNVNNNNGEFITIFASGSEVSLAIDVANQLQNKINERQNSKQIKNKTKATMIPNHQNIYIRVMSVYCLELFQQLNDRQKKQILHTNYNDNYTHCDIRDGCDSHGDNYRMNNIFNIVIEAGTCCCLTNFVNKFCCNKTITINVMEFGKSAKAKDIAECFGFTADKIVKKLKNVFFKNR